jgi:hypothetical protein
MDPLSTVAGITGILAFTGQLARNLTTLTSEIRDAPDDIVDLQSELQNLVSLIRSAQDVAAKYGLHAEDAPLAETVKNCLEQCQTTMEAIREQLKVFLSVSSGSGRRSPMGVRRTLFWVMRKGEIQNLRNRLRDSKASLSLAVMVLNG